MSRLMRPATTSAGRERWSWAVPVTTMGSTGSTQGLGAAIARLFAERGVELQIRWLHRQKRAGEIDEGSLRHDDEIGAQDQPLHREVGAHHRLDPPAVDPIDVPEPVDVLVDDRDLGLHA